MRIIDLDGTNWTSVIDFYDAILSALGAPSEHGKNVNALVDSMIWGGINELVPPYTIRIRHMAGLSKDLADEIEAAKRSLREARLDFQSREGRDVDVQLETLP
jgi:RNAse (barnase) inhibitor barstar